MKNYGLPYKGSKNTIARELIREIPGGTRFIDLFGGGAAMTYAALLSGKYQSVLYNDKEPLIVQFFKDTLNGRFKTGFQPEWVSAEDFKKLKDQDGYIRYAWSFGNNGREYLYNPFIEPIKKQAHEYIYYKKPLIDLGIKAIHDTPQERKAYLQRIAKDRLKKIYQKEPNAKKEYKEFAKITTNGAPIFTPEETVEFTTWLRSTGIRAKEVDQLTDSFMSSHYLCTKVDGQPAIPTPEMFELLKRSDKIKNIPDRIKELVGTEKSLKERKTAAILKAYEHRADVLSRAQYYFRLNNLTRLANVERVMRLGEIGEELSKKKIIITNKDYREYKPIDGDIIYCDIPYQDTDSYNAGAFDHDAFYKWASSLNYPVYVSSYNINTEGLYLIYAKRKKSNLASAGYGADVWEKLYANKAGKDLYG